MASQIVKSQTAKKMSNESLRIYYTLTRDYSCQSFYVVIMGGYGAFLS